MISHGTRALRAIARSRRTDLVAAALALAFVLAGLLAPPSGLLDKADRAAYAVCHRLPERTFSVAGRPLPLCARCSGTYLGLAVGLAVLAARGRSRASQFPAPKHLAVFAAFLLIWAIDGLNSYLSFFPGLPHLYKPQNILRLITGTLQGLALAVVALPAINAGLWADPDDSAAVANWADLLWMLAGGALVVAAVSSEWSPILYPLAIASGLTIVASIAALNVMVLLLVTGRSGRLERWPDVLVLALVGLALAAVELAGMGAVRMALEGWLGWPF